VHDSMRVSVSRYFIRPLTFWCKPRAGSSPAPQSSPFAAPSPYSHHTTWQTALKYTQLFDLVPEISGYTTPTLYPADAA
jgi:hypothetical protein